MNRENLIITIGREFGSGGHIIGERLAEYYDIPLYDRDLLKMVSEENDIDYEEIEEYETAMGIPGAAPVQQEIPHNAQMIGEILFIVQ